MRAISPVEIGCVYQTNPGLIHEGGRLQSVAMPFRAHVTARQGPQLVRDQRARHSIACWSPPATGACRKERTAAVYGGVELAGWFEEIERFEYFLAATP